MLALLRLLPTLYLLAIAVPARSSVAAPLQRGCSALLVLDLRADPTPGKPASAPPMPPGGIHLRVPLFPGARRSSRPMPMASYVFPESWYRKDARIAYLAPANGNTVQAWYSTAFEGCGFHPSGSGSTGSRGGIVVQSLSFSFGSRDYDQITLSFQQAGAGRTLVLYAASVITLPPPQILVPGSPTAATVAYYTSYAAAGVPRAVVPIQPGATLSALVRELNHLPVVDGIEFCPLDTGAHDAMWFGYAHRQPLLLTVGLSGCRYVGRDANLAVAHSTNTLLRLLDRIERGR